jgi:NAD(P)-dependent dehydrogenase (short-subunit alcohol dehydrogenase family)
MRMDDKTVLITGANSGVGFAAARKLAELGATVVMVCRNAQRGDAARAEVAKTATGPAPTLLFADLSLQASVRALAVEVRARFSRMDVLLNNAASMFPKRELTAEGIEKTFAINHLASFLLTSLLADLVHAAPAGRIITVTSDSHSGALDFGNLQGERDFNFFAAYNRTKLCNILFTYELARRWKGTTTTANCVSPGPTRTSFGSELKGLPALFPILVKKIPFLLRSPEKSAEAYVYLASSPDVAEVSSRFFRRLREARTKPISYDPTVATRLWKISEDLCENTAAISRGVSPHEPFVARATARRA